MDDTPYMRSTSNVSGRRSGVSLRAVLGTTLLAFLGGAALVGWLAWDGRLSFGDTAVPPAASDTFAAPTRLAPSAATAPATALPAPNTAAGGMDQRIAALEQRLARLDLQTAASEGNTARAEALLVALAARRAIERGLPLGYLDQQLKLRFGEAQAASVTTLSANAARPVTVASLGTGLEGLAPALLGGKGAGGWTRFADQVSGMFTIRRGDAPSTRPDQRLDRARLLLRSGQVEAAAAEVERLPGKAAANDWLAAAARYAASQKALDQIETAALLEPAQLNDAEGQAVRQPGPVSAPLPDQSGSEASATF